MLMLRLQTHQLQRCFLTLICQPVQAVAPVQNARKEARAAARNTMASAGAGWYDMKAQAITPEVKRDWRLLRLRSAYNPRHFYKVHLSCPYDLHEAIQRTIFLKRSACHKLQGSLHVTHLAGSFASWPSYHTEQLSHQHFNCCVCRMQGFDSTKIPKHFEMGTVVEGSGEFYSGRMTKRERKQTFTEEILADVQVQKERKRRYEAMQAEKQELAKKRKKMKSHHKRSRHRPQH